MMTTDTREVNPLDAKCSKDGCTNVGRLTFKYGNWWCDSHMPIFDPVERPKHYAASNIQPIDAIEAWGLGFHLGNVVRYVARGGKKDGEPILKDLKKALWYLQREIDRLEGKPRKDP